MPKLSTQDTISARLDALSERMSEPSGVRSMRCPSLQMRSPTYVAADFGNFMTAVKGDSSMMPKVSGALSPASCVPNRYCVISAFLKRCRGRLEGLSWRFFRLPSPVFLQEPASHVNGAAV